MRIPRNSRKCDNTRRMKALTQSFFIRHGVLVARELLGMMLCRKTSDGSVQRGRIVETEAYDGPDDQASHAFRGRTLRTAPMFETGGIVYVYLIYGIHHCLNVVTGEQGYPSAVLLRGVELPAGDLSARGPGRLSRRFEIDRSLDGASLLGVRGGRIGNRAGLWIEAGPPLNDREIESTPRIGVDYAGKWVKARRRFIVKGSAAVSR
jgi:DNA-3-methyladenine glycosylase